MSWSLWLAEVLSMSSGFSRMCFKACGINGPRFEMGNSLILIAESVWLGCVNE